MGKAIRACALIFLLAAPAHAGFLPNGSPAAPAPAPTPQSLLREPAEGVGADTAQTFEEITAETFLSALTSVLALI